MRILFYCSLGILLNHIYFSAGKYQNPNDFNNKH